MQTEDEDNYASLVLGSRVEVWEGTPPRVWTRPWVSEVDMPVREAEELAGTIAHLLEERRKTAPNPEYPV